MVCVCVCGGVGGGLCGGGVGQGVPYLTMSFWLVSDCGSKLR